MAIAKGIGNGMMKIDSLNGDEQDALNRSYAAIAGQISTAVNPPIVMTDNTATGVPLLSGMETRVKSAPSETLGMSIMKANNGYVIQTRKDVYVCMDMEALRDNIVRMVADWEMDK